MSEGGSLRTISVNMKCGTTEGKGFKIEHEQDQSTNDDAQCGM